VLTPSEVKPFLTHPKEVIREFAANGKSGLALAQELHPDGIVLDLLLPDIQGGEVL